MRCGVNARVPFNPDFVEDDPASAFLLAGVDGLKSIAAAAADEKEKEKEKEMAHLPTAPQKRHYANYL